MTLDAILSSIDTEITRLQHVRALLTQTSAAPAKKSVGRPKKTSPAVAIPAAKKRAMSAEGKARIAAAQKKRWAAMKKKTN